MSKDSNRRRTTTLSASALIVAAITVSLLYFTLPQSWLTKLCELLFFPSIVAISGGLAAIWAGSAIAKPLLDTYLERKGYGLAKRKVYFRGSEPLIQDLIEPKNYSRTNVSLEDADIAILCIDWQPPLDTDPKEIEKKTKQWKSDADKTVSDFIEEINKNTQSEDHKGLIVYTNGWFLDSTKQTINNRPFSVLVNFSGRIVSDIHSLLTTLPPRNGK